MSANDKQVGGDHYKKIEGGEEHWDRQWRMNGRGYFVGCITKYVERYPFKNGIQDLEKAKHFLEKLIELEKAEYAKRLDVIGSIKSPSEPVIMKDGPILTMPKGYESMSKDFANPYRFAQEN